MSKTKAENAVDDEKNQRTPSNTLDEKSAEAASTGPKTVGNTNVKGEPASATPPVLTIVDDSGPITQEQLDTLKDANGDPIDPPLATSLAAQEIFESHPTGLAGATLSETRPTLHNVAIHDAIAENDPQLPHDQGAVVKRGDDKTPNGLWTRLNELARANRIRPGMNMKFNKTEYLVILDNDDYVFSPVAGLTLDNTYSSDKMTMPVKPGGHVSIQE